MPELVQFLIRNAVIGIVIAIVAMIVALTLDLGGLRSLAMGSDVGFLAIGALTWALSLTFASAQMGFAIMLLKEKDAEDDGAKSRQMLAQFLRPAPLAMRVRNRMTGGAEDHSLP